MAIKRTRESEEMYLETILLLHKGQPNVRAVDVRDELGLAKSSVSRGVNLLEKKGYIHIDRETGNLSFTDAGRKKSRGYLRAASDAHKGAYKARSKPRTCRRKRLPHGTRRLRRDDGSVPELYQRVRKKGTPRAFLFLCRQIFRKNLINRSKYI